MTDTRRARLAPFRRAQRRFRPDPRRFEQLVHEALATVPEPFRARLHNVAVRVEEEPDPALLARLGYPPDEELLGLYEGTPLIQRGNDYHLVPPDRITIFRRPILAICATPEDVRREVRATVVHEIAHYFGIDDAELEALEREA